MKKINKSLAIIYGITCVNVSPHTIYSLKIVSFIFDIDQMMGLDDTLLQASLCLFNVRYIIRLNSRTLYKQRTLVLVFPTTYHFIIQWDITTKN